MADETNTCAPREATCQERAISTQGWYASICSILCATQQWIAGLFDNTKLAPYGTVLMSPQSVFIDAPAAAKVATVPAGAISIEALIDNEAAATYRLEVKKASDASYVTLPAGTDFSLAAVTPVFTADENGRNTQRGVGVYPSYMFRFPIGCRGVVNAVFLDGTKTITVN